MNTLQPQLALLLCLFGFSELTIAQEIEPFPIDLIELLGELGADDQQTTEALLTTIDQSKTKSNKSKEHAGEPHE